MSKVNFFNLCLKIFMEKKKPIGPGFYWNLTSGISVYRRSNVKLHAIWSTFLCHLSENECPEQVLENFRNVKIFLDKNSFVSNNFRRHSLLIGKYFCCRKKNSLFTDRGFTDKVYDSIKHTLVRYNFLLIVKNAAIIISMRVLMTSYDSNLHVPWGKWNDNKVWETS